MILELKIHDSIAERFKAFLELFPKSKVKVSDKSRLKKDRNIPNAKTIRAIGAIERGETEKISFEEHIKEINAIREKHAKAG